MKKNKTIAITILCCLLLISSFTRGQQALWGNDEIISPEVHSDNTVTFRLHAPAANEVKVFGDWIPAEGRMPGSSKLTKDKEGVWTHTTNPLPSELYSYWFTVDGVRCSDPGNVYLIRDVSSMFNVFITGGEKGDLYSVGKVPHGTVARRWYNSPTLGFYRRITIYTPPGYESSLNHYPVLYLLHGMGGDEEAWISLGRTAQILDNLIAQEKAIPMIVVMTNGNVVQEAAPGESSLGLFKPTMRLPNTMDGTFESSFPDVIKFIESNYRVKPEKSQRAIAGLSMGGFHSLHISRYYPNTFDYIGLFSAAVLPNQNVTSKIYENFEETLKKQSENGYKLYWIGMGKTDFLYDGGVQFRKKLDDIGMNYTYVESEGGHTWSNWRDYLGQFVQLIFQ
jgi:enterochelin esterase-like enzyme